MSFTNILFCLLISVSACSQKPTNKEVKKISGYVGDIAPDSALDDPAFEKCNEGHVFQFFNDSNGLQYEGEKSAIKAAFHGYNHQVVTGESGLIRIRFIVNCKGETGRFRLMAMNVNYQEKSFPKTITRQLMKITQSLKGWQTKFIQGSEIDYYQYLIFKIEDAQLIEIMP